MYRNKEKQTSSRQLRLYDLPGLYTKKLGLAYLRSYLHKSNHKAEESKNNVKSNTMRTEFVQLDKVPVRVDYWGTWSPSKMLTEEKKPDDLILVVPGNPGVTKFYYKFISKLYSKLKKPIWIVSHGGHDKVTDKKRTPPSLRKNRDLYTLEGQTKQKQLLIETYLKDVKLYCIGHSIGCKMLLSLLDNEEKINIEECFFLFPTIERMAETRNGQILLFVVKYLLWLVLFGSYIFVYLPKPIQVLLVRSYCIITRMSSHNVASILQLVDPYVLKNVFFLAKDEMKVVNELDDKAIEKYGYKLNLYYGATDGWTPLNYFEQLKKKHPSVQAEVCSKGYMHAFVLENSDGIADLIYDWLKEKYTYSQ